MIDWKKTYSGLQFEHRPLTPPHPLIPIAMVLVFFTLLWVVVPPSTLYWLLLALLAVFGWIASYGWRQALAVFIALLQRFEQL